MNNIQIPPVVKNLLIINILFFVATWVMQSKGIDLAFYLGAFYFDSPLFKIWRPISYMFMHGGFTHILFNMCAGEPLGAEEVPELLPDYGFGCTGFTASGAVDRGL